MKVISTILGSVADGIGLILYAAIIYYCVIFIICKLKSYASLTEKWCKAGIPVWVLCLLLYVGIVWLLHIYTITHGRVLLVFLIGFLAARAAVLSTKAEKEHFRD